MESYQLAIIAQIAKAAIRIFLQGRCQENHKWLWYHTVGSMLQKKTGVSIFKSNRETHGSREVIRGHRATLHRNIVNSYAWVGRSHFPAVQKAQIFSETLCSKPHCVWGIKYSKMKGKEGRKLWNACYFYDSHKKRAIKIFFRHHNANDLMLWLEMALDVKLLRRQFYLGFGGWAVH